MIASDIKKQYYEHHEVIFEHINNNYNVVINSAKKIFGVEDIKFLGYLVNVNGIKPLPERIEVIKNFYKTKNS